MFEQLKGNLHAIICRKHFSVIFKHALDLFYRLLQFCISEDIDFHEIVVKVSNL